MRRYAHPVLKTSEILQQTKAREYCKILQKGAEPLRNAGLRWLHLQTVRLQGQGKRTAANTPLAPNPDPERGTISP